MPGSWQQIKTHHIKIAKIVICIMRGGSFVARINIEDSLFKDTRFFDLVVILGSKTTALGALVEAWIVAQNFWKLNHNGIPKKEWEKQKLNPALIQSGLAIDRGDFIYIAGSEEQFAWLVQRQEAGKKGGPAAAKARLENIEEFPRRNTTEYDGSRPPSPSPSPSPSLTLSLNAFSKGKGSTEVSPLPPRVQSEIGFFIARYVKAYQSRYGPKARPSLQGKTQGQIKRFLSETPFDRACNLIEVYCQMDDPWFKKKCHDFSTFVENLNKVSLALDTGRDPGSGPTIEEILGVTPDEEQNELL